MTTTNKGHDKDYGTVLGELEGEKINNGIDGKVNVRERAWGEEDGEEREEVDGKSNTLLQINTPCHFCFVVGFELDLVQNMRLMGLACLNSSLPRSLPFPSLPFPSIPFPPSP